MKTLRSRYATFVLSWKVLTEQAPELRSFSVRLLRAYISERFHIACGKDRANRLKRTGTLTIKRKVSNAIDVDKESIFNALYSELIERTHRYGKCVKVKRVGSGTEVTYIGTFKVLSTLIEREVERNDVRIEIENKDGKVKEVLTYRGQEGETKVYGLLHSFVYSLFHDSKGDAITGQRKGVNTKRWFNVVSAKDILQLVSLRLWDLVITDSRLIDKARYQVDDVTHRKRDLLLAHLNTCARNIFYDSLEKIMLSEKTGKPKHQQNGEGKYTRRIMRTYSFGSLAELVENIDGTFSLIDVPEED